MAILTPQALSVRLLVLTAVVFAHGDHDHDHEGEDASAGSICGAVGDMDDYDTAMHIGAIFIVFAVSIVGSMLPVLSSYVSCLRNNSSILSLLNSFGFGVVVATAFIHMIPSASESLNNPCLNVGYSGLAMVIVVLTVLVMQALETELLLFWTKKAIATCSTDVEKADGYDLASTPVADHHHPHHHHPVGLVEDANATSAMRKVINVLIFEVGVAIHSFIIGLDLGVATGSSFNTLLVAISFHQFFEGVAVGSSAVSAFTSTRSSVLTAIGYSLTTPLGMALGVAISSSYSDTSSASLWVRGTLDAIAGGILVYTGLVELLTYQYTINQEFHAKPMSMRSLAYLFLWLGAGAMAIVGYWA
ncbi:Aste57867_14794 [Aphanomyces stellatus]|uniref:Aste57867_14794 protein n=1 Tax=Aphanomyces stellatus TaxID=120398 RepID=A0A485L3D1_9STRA|nr:hypothetical protein As57867_014739 [Aphanomyces stellatus]VFT91612.1 Aste57867_14794 [Aphanomyces stellatus]